LTSKGPRFCALDYTAQDAEDFMMVVSRS